MRQEHVASLGAIEVPPSVAARVAFWQGAHQTLGRLSNRIDAAALAALLGQLHDRVPMATQDEIRALQLENARQDERVWSALEDMHQESAEGHDGLAQKARQVADDAKAAAGQAAERATAARQRLERLASGEQVAGGLGAPVDIVRVLKEAGWKAKDFRRARMSAEISRLGGFEELIAEILKQHASGEDVARRRVLRRLLARRSVS